MASSDLQAIILAGGRGERLRPYTDDRPKPMVLILDKPILEYQVCWLASHGVQRVVMSCGYLHNVIQDYFGDGSKFGVEIRYAIEEEALGRGGGIKWAWNELAPSDAPIVATNGDVMTSFDLQAMVDSHRQAGAMASILLAPYISQYGIVDVDEHHRVVGFRSEPRLPYWINAGVYVMEQAVRELLPDRGDHEASTFPQLAQQGKLHGFQNERFWRAVDTVKDLTTVRNRLTEQMMQAFIGATYRQRQ